MKKKKAAVTLTILLLAIAAVVCAVWLTAVKPLGKQISAKGYEISVPKSWSFGADGILTDKKGSIVGKFVLVNEEPDLSNVAAYSGFEVQGEVKTESKTEVILKNVFETDSGMAVQYFIKDIPNPEPYAVSITLLRPGVGNITGERIAASFKIPEIGSKPPRKNITAPSYEDIAEDKTAKLVLENGNTSVKNASLIDMFIGMQKKNERTGLDILSFEQTDGSEVLREWVHIESDAGRGFLYTYYDIGNGIYTYDNNPVMFDSITKEAAEDTEITSYCLKIGETETTKLLEIPLNIYRDNAEALVALKTAESTDEAAMNVLEQILEPEQLKNVSAAKTSDGLEIVFGENEMLDSAKISKDAAVIFSLLSDIEVINVSVTNGDNFVLKRNDVLKNTAEDAEAAADSPENFAKFAEKIESVPPAKPKDSANSGKESSVNGAADGEIVYSSTVQFSANTKVKHPNTGEMVEIGPYAEKLGVSQYLNKPITCTIKKSGSAYMVTATCNGSVIYSQPLEDEAAVQNMISQIKAYS